MTSLRTFHMPESPSALSRKECVIRLYFSWAISLFVFLTLPLPSGYSIGMLLLLLGSLALPFVRLRYPLLSEDRWLIGSFLGVFVVSAALNFYHGLPGSSYELPSRLLLVVPVLFALIAFPARFSFFWLGLVPGVTITGAWGLVASAADVRFGAHMNPIQFGNISMLLGLLALVGLLWARDQPGAGWWKLWLMLGAAAGILGSFLSGARGGWLCLLLVFVLGAWFIWRGGYPFRALLAVVLVSGLFACSYWLDFAGIQTRVDTAAIEVTSFFYGGNVDTSSGLRLHMWRWGWHAFLERPLLGWGDFQGIYEYAQGHFMVSDSVKNLSHLHNEILDRLAKFGLVGGATLLATYFIPLVIFWRHRCRSDGGLRPAALAGILVVVCTLIFGLTQAFLLHNSGMSIYVFLVVILWGYLRQDIQPKLQVS